MAVNKLTTLAAVMNEAQREGKVLGFDTVSGDIRTYDADYIGGGGSGGGISEDSEITAANSSVTKTLSEWFATGLVVRDIETLKQLPGFEADQIVHVLGYYADTRGIGGGTFVWNSGSTYPSNDGTVIAVEGQGSGRWNRILSDPMTIRSEDFGLFNGRETQPGVALIIDEMRRSCPEGGTLRFYPCDNPIRTDKVRIEDRSLTIDMGGNRFAGVDNAQVFELVGSVGTPSAVDFFETTSFNDLGYEGDSARELTVVYFPDATDYNVGDVVKVISEDEIPELFNPNRKLGQFSTVAAVNTNSITLYDKLFDHDLYQTDVRIAKVNDYSMSVVNGYFIADDQAADVEWGPSRIHMEMLKHPRIENVHGINLDRRLASLYSCYQFVMEDCHVINSGNYPVGEGYVLNDVGGYGGFARNISSDHCRHVVTTNSRATTELDDFNRGRGLHLTVVGGIGKFSYNHAFDTHPEAAYTTFIGCKAYQCDGGFQSRSPHTTFEACEAYECPAPFQVGTARENYTNAGRYTTIKGCKAINIEQETYRGFLNFTGDDLTGVKYGPVFVSDCEIEYVNHTNTVLNALLDANLASAEVHFNNNKVRMRDNSSQRLFKITMSNDSFLYMDGNVFVSYEAAAADFRLVQFTGTWPTSGPEPTAYVTNNTFIGPAALDALVADASAFMSGNTVQNVTDTFAAHKFSGTVITPGHTD